MQLGPLKRAYCRLSGKDTLEVTVTIGVAIGYWMMGRKEYLVVVCSRSSTYTGELYNRKTLILVAVR